MGVRVFSCCTLVGTNDGLEVGTGDVVVDFATGD